MKSSVEMFQILPYFFRITKIQFYFSVFHLVYFFCIMIALAHMDMDHSSEKKKYSTKWKTEKVVLI